MHYPLSILYPLDSVRSFLKKQKKGRYNEEEMANKESELAAQEAQEEDAAKAITVGSRCQVQVSGQPTKIGTVMYVGKCSTLIQLNALWILT